MENRDHELIDDYLHGLLSEDEEQALEARLVNEPELAEHLDLHLALLREAPQGGDEVQRVRAEAGELWDKYFADSKPSENLPIKSKRKWWWPSVLGTVLVILCLLISFFWFKEDVKPSTNSGPLPSVTPMQDNSTPLDLDSVSQVESEMNGRDSLKNQKKAKPSKKTDKPPVAQTELKAEPGIRVAGHGVWKGTIPVTLLTISADQTSNGIALPNVQLQVLPGKDTSQWQYRYSGQSIFLYSPGKRATADFTKFRFVKLEKKDHQPIYFLKNEIGQWFSIRNNDAANPLVPETDPAIIGLLNKN